MVDIHVQFKFCLFLSFIGQSVTLCFSETSVLSLVDLCCKCVAQNLPFETLELAPVPIPGDLQLKVISMSFPNDVEDIRLYSTLASGSADQFNRGEDLYNYKAVQDCLQIGEFIMHLYSSSLCE